MFRFAECFSYSDGCLSFFAPLIRAVVCLLDRGRVSVFAPDCSADILFCLLNLVPCIGTFDLPVCRIQVSCVNEICL